jgi:hypothetical protein
MFSSPFSLPSRQLSDLLLRSQLSLTRSQGTLYWFGLGFPWEGGREEQHVVGHATAADSFGKRKGHLLSLSLSPCIYTPH